MSGKNISRFWDTNTKKAVIGIVTVVVLGGGGLKKSQMDDSDDFRSRVDALEMQMDALTENDIRLSGRMIKVEKSLQLPHLILTAP